MHAYHLIYSSNLPVLVTVLIIGRKRDAGVKLWSIQMEYSRTRLLVLSR